MPHIALVVSETGNYQQPCVYPYSLSIDMKSVLDEAFVDQGPLTDAQKQALEPIRLGFPSSALDDLEQGDTPEFFKLNYWKAQCLANHMISHLPETVQRPNIEGGWAAPRGAFHLVYELPERKPHSHVIEQLIGYTDYWGVTTTGIMDPETRLYFQRIQSFNFAEVSSPDGVHEVPDLTHDAFILTNEYGRTVHTATLQNLLERARMHSVMPPMMGHGTILDMRGELHRVPRPVESREHHLATYLNTAMTAYHEASVDGIGELLEGDESMLLADTISRVRNPMLNRFGFFEQLMMKTNYAHDGYITLRELADIFPELSVTTIPGLRDVPEDQVITGEPSHEEACCYHFANYLNAMLPSAGVGSAALSVDFVNGRWTPHLVSCRPLFQHNLTREQIDELMAMVEQTLEHIPFRDNFTQMNVYYNQVGPTGIRLVNGGTRSYSFPNFAAGLTSPLILGETHRIDVLSNDLKYLLAQTSGDHEVSATIEAMGTRPKW